MNSTHRRTLSVVIALLCCVPVAQAGASPLLLGFGERYVTSEGTSIHRGIDIACAQGDAAPSLVDGRVTFAGRLPGSDSALAVTVESGDQRVTVSPLREVAVEKGETVSEGDALGSAASEGDPSTTQPHLHVSLRRGDVYLDPSGLLPQRVVPEQGATGDAVPASAPGVIEGGSGASVAVPPVNAAPGVVAQGVSLAPVAMDAESGEHVRQVANGAIQQASTEAKVRASGVEGQIADGVSLVPAHAVAAPFDAASVRTASARRFAAALRAALTCAKASMKNPLAVFWLVAACAAAGLLVSRRALDRRLESTTPVSDRFGTMLQHARTGAKLCGLTSCSGLLPSLVPEPLSPEEVTK